MLVYHGVLGESFFVLGKENYLLDKTKASFFNLPFSCIATLGSFVLLVIFLRMSLHHYSKVSIL